MRCIAKLLVLLFVLVIAGCGASGVQADAEAPQPTRQSAAKSQPLASSVETDSTQPVTSTAAGSIVATQLPAETLQLMLTLAEAGNWGAFVDHHYGETEKFSSDKDRDALVSRFEGEWGSRMLEALKNASTLTPTVESNGRAVFLEDGKPVFMLHRHADGRWTFHL